MTHSLCHLCNEQLKARYAGSAAQLAAVASASVPEKENLAEGASAMVTAALRLQPLLARAQKLRTQDQAMALTSTKNINGEVSIVFSTKRPLSLVPCDDSAASVAMTVGM